MDSSHNRAPFDESAIAAVFERAGQQLAEFARGQRIVVLVAWPNPVTGIEEHSSGWCEIGKISDPAGRFWWIVLRNPGRARGRLVRYFERAARGSLGEILQPE